MYLINLVSNVSRLQSFALSNKPVYLSIMFELKKYHYLIGYKFQRKIDNLHHFHQENLDFNNSFTGLFISQILLKSERRKLVF